MRVRYCEVPVRSLRKCKHFRQRSAATRSRINSVVSFCRMAALRLRVKHPFQTRVSLKTQKPLKPQSTLQYSFGYLSCLLRTSELMVEIGADSIPLDSVQKIGHRLQMSLSQHRELT